MIYRVVVVRVQEQVHSVDADSVDEASAKGLSLSIAIPEEWVTVGMDAEVDPE
jgi:hypothetical protein